MYLPPVLTFRIFSFFSHSPFIPFVCISQQTANFALCVTRWLVFITEIASVYCKVVSGALNRTVYVTSLKLLMHARPGSVAAIQQFKLPNTYASWEFRPSDIHAEILKPCHTVSASKCLRMSFFFLIYTPCLDWLLQPRPVPSVARSKAYVCRRSLPEIVL